MEQQHEQQQEQQQQQEMELEPPQQQEHRAEDEPGVHQDSTTWHCSCGDGFIYHRRRNQLSRHGGGWSYTCCRRACPGRARSQLDGTLMRISTPHNHPADPVLRELHSTKRDILAAAMDAPHRLIEETVRHRVME